MILQANSFQIPLKNESVQCVITSPPYWGLRDYGLQPLVIGENNCVHEWETMKLARAGRDDEFYGGKSIANETEPRKPIESNFCLKCNAWRGCLGLEPTSELYIEHMVQIFREVWRVLRKDGTVFLNMGDSYAGSWGNYSPNTDTPGEGWSKNRWSRPSYDKRDWRPANSFPQKGLKPKDLCGIPWRLALALQAEGWYLRSDIIWEKPNPMPESCTDRPTKSHEYIFLLTKSANYFWDADAIREKPISKNLKFAEDLRGKGWNNHENDLEKGNRQLLSTNKKAVPIAGRNARSVWTIATEAFDMEMCDNCKEIYFAKEYRKLIIHIELKNEEKTQHRVCRVCGMWDKWLSHFATFGTELVARCIKAGTSEKGCCVKCGAPWERVVETNKAPKSTAKISEFASKRQRDEFGHFEYMERDKQITHRTDRHIPFSQKTIGWQPTCKCYEGDGEDKIKPCVVFDPFGGSGTVLDTANRMQRKGIVMDLKWEYLKMAQKRCVKNQEELAL